MQSYIQSVEMDFGRIIALWEMCEHTGSTNDELEKYSSENFTAGSLVSYTSMITELVITIGRLLDRSRDRKTKKYNSYSLVSLLEHYKKQNELNEEEYNVATFKLQQLDSIYKSAEFKELISHFRNKCLAHTDIGFNMKQGDIKSIFEFCHELECFIISLGFSLGIEIDISVDYHIIWRKEAKRYWGSLK